MVRNPLYCGQVRHKGEVYPGEHDGIVTKREFKKVQAQLEKNRRNGGACARNRHAFLLRGLLRCSACGASYSPTTTKKGSRVYRYYTCASAQKRGWQTCPQPSIQAKRIEDLIVEQVRRIGQDADLVGATVNQADVAHVFSLFDLWDLLFPREQSRIIGLIVTSVDYDGNTGKLGIEFTPTGIKALAAELEEAKEHIA